MLTFTSVLLPTTVFIITCVSSIPSTLSFSGNVDSSTIVTASNSKQYELRPYDPTRESDRSSLEEICANEFGGSDYVPRMASIYAADPACSFLALTKKSDIDDSNSNVDDAIAITEGNNDGGHKIVAVANYKRLPAQSSAWIEGVRTHPDHRKQGLASSILQAMVDLAKEEQESENNDNTQPTNILACTIQSNEGSLRAFEKVGFAQCNTIQILSFEKMVRLPGWSSKSKSDKVPEPLLDALDLKHLVSPNAKAISSSSWNTITSSEVLLDKLQKCKKDGGCSGYLPGLYEYIVPGREDLSQSMEQGLVLALDIGSTGSDTNEGDPGQAILALTQDERVSSLKSNWVCSIIAYTPIAFEAAFWHAHSIDIAQRINSFQCKYGSDPDIQADEIESEDTPPFCLAFDDALPLQPGTLAHTLPRVTDQCIVLSYQHN